MRGDENLIDVLNTLILFEINRMPKINYIEKALRYLSMNRYGKNSLASLLFIFNNMKYISPSNGVFTRLLKIFRKLVFK